MATTTLDKAGCGCDDRARAVADGLLPSDPFTALQYHFGMLLGVDDLETAQAYHRGKMRLHNAWLHGEGAIWGLDVTFNARRELSVSPGLALDAAGRELHLDAVACVDLGKWYDKHKDDEDFVAAARGDAADARRVDRAANLGFDVHVVARFRACLARPVPAIADPCAGSEVDTAFSRVSETIELLIRPGRAPQKDRGFHRLRILFSLEPDAPAYDEVRTRREQILALPLDQQPLGYLTAFREFAALDEIDRQPQRDENGARTGIVPEDPTEVVLANVLHVRVREGVNGSVLVDPLPTIDVRVRPSLVPTSTIQELLNGPLFAAPAGNPPPDGNGNPAPPPEPGVPGEPAPPPEPVPQPEPAVDEGPRIYPESARAETPRRLTMTATKPIAPPSVDRSQFDVTTYADDDGWSSLDIAASRLDAAGTTITLELKEPMPEGHLVRLIARGTGPEPILGVDLRPLAGRVGGPPGSADDGHDFVIILGRR